MSLKFAEILQGLMENRRLTPRTVARASARAQSTINQLLDGRILPHVDLLQDIAPILQIPLSDLLVIAGLPAESISNRAQPYPASVEVGHLIAVASFLTPEQVERLVDLARTLKAQNPEETS
jgi:transcriptional regulator with XRE-family HTH domain